MKAWMRRFFLSSTLLVFVLGVLSPVHAQVHGVPASVTSFGFGGNMSPAPGVPASVTSLGPNGYGGNPFQGHNNVFFGTTPSGSSHHHWQGDRNYFPVAVPVYSAPYTQVVVVQAAASEDAEEEDGGTTVSERPARGKPAQKQVAEAPPTPPPAAEPSLKNR